MSQVDHQVDEVELLELIERLSGGAVQQVRLMDDKFVKKNLFEKEFKRGAEGKRILTFGML